MASFTLAQILDATNGTLIAGKPAMRMAGISTDTRLVKRNQVFIAIKGDNFDGHDFLAQAVKKGARAVMVSRKGVAIPQGAAVILVDDTVKALGRIARLHRQRFCIPLIAVTGSAGKTSTKELIAAVLRKKYRVLFNKGTENNHMGVPMTLLKLTRRHEVAVIEMGTNHPGEIAWLAQNACPTVAVFTNVGASHLEGLGTPEGVYQEKVSLLNFIPDDGSMVVNADDPFWSRLLKKKLSQQVISYGVKAQADVQAQEIRVGADGVCFKTGQARMFMVKSPSLGAVQNALAAIACGRLLGVPEVKIQDALKKASPAKGRQCMIKAGGVTIMDDTYNANPLSYENALQTLGMLKNGHGRAVLVAADMLELGPASDELHAGVGVAAVAAGVDAIFCYGINARLIAQAARKKRIDLDGGYFDDQAALTQALQGYLRSGDVLLVKGSRGMRMERIVQAIQVFLKG